MPFESHISSDARSDPALESSPGPMDAPASRADPQSQVAAPPPEISDGATAVAPIWLQRLSLFVLVVFCVYLGGLVAFLPWWTRVWDHNLFILSHPALAAVLHNGAVRGIISGLGLLDIWIGVSEAIHYRDHRPASQ